MGSKHLLCVTCTQKMTSVNKVTAEPLTDDEIDHLLANLSSDEIEKLLEDVESNPDDTFLPPSARCTYHCDKKPTGPYNRKKLLNYIYDQAKKTPDKIDYVPHVPGVTRGKKWEAPQREQELSFDNEDIELDIEIGDEFELALNDASTTDMIDLAGIMGLHSMMTQVQYHHAVGTKTFRDEDDEEQTDVNLNNVEVSEKQFLEIFEALRENKVLTNFAIANTSLTDWAAANLCHTLENNQLLESINVESNNITPATMAKLFESLNMTQSVKEFKAMNQAAQIMGNKVEMAITKSIEKNKTLLKVGIQFEYPDCQNRVAVHLQKNLDRIRIKRIAEKLAEREKSGYFMWPSVKPAEIPEQQKEWKKAEEPEDEWEYHYSD